MKSKCTRVCVAVGRKSYVRVLTLIGWHESDQFIVYMYNTQTLQIAQSTTLTSIGCAIKDSKCPSYCIRKTACVHAIKNMLLVHVRSVWHSCQLRHPFISQIEQFAPVQLWFSIQHHLDFIHWINLSQLRMTLSWTDWWCLCEWYWPIAFSHSSLTCVHRFVHWWWWQSLRKCWQRVEPN